MAGLVSYAAGLAASRALRGRTLAADRVRLEPKAPINVSAPTICVYAASGRAHISGRRLLEATICRPRFELFLPSAVNAEGLSGSIELDVDTSSALAFACFWRQCEIALQADQSVWAQLFRAIVLEITMIETGADLFELDKGQKIAARIVEMTVDTINEPMIGTAPQGVWADLLVAMRGDSAEIAGLADVVERQIRGDVALAAWEADFALLGLSQSYGPMLGVAGAPGDLADLPDVVADIEEPADSTTTEPQS
jgi:hypothetical protein